MSDEFANISDLELLSLIKRAEDELEDRKRASRDKLVEEIQEKIRGSGLTLRDLFPETGAKKRKSNEGETNEVKPKYRDPVSQETWSGRGARPPLWVKRIMAERGWMLDEFKRSGEYDV